MARYAAIDWNVNGSPAADDWTLAGEVAWTDFDAGGSSPCCDGSLDVAVEAGDYDLTPTRRYLGRTLHEELEPGGQGGYAGCHADPSGRHACCGSTTAASLVSKIEYKGRRRSRGFGGFEDRVHRRRVGRLECGMPSPSAA